MIIQEIKKQERPRERAIHEGLDHLSNRELLAILLRVGTKGKNALELADEILYRYSLNELASCTLKELKQFKGCGDSKALELLACFELSKRILKEKAKEQKSLHSLSELTYWLQQEIGGKKQENFMAIYFDNSNQIITSKILFVGDKTHSMIHPREIFNQAIQCGAVKMVVAHNHPSQNLEISKDDIRTTYILVKNGEMLGIPVIDHLVVSRTETVSIVKSEFYKEYAAYMNGEIL